MIGSMRSADDDEAQPDLETDAWDRAADILSEMENEPDHVLSSYERGQRLGEALLVEMEADPDGRARAMKEAINELWSEAQALERLLLRTKGLMAAISDVHYRCLDCSAYLPEMFMVRDPLWRSTMAERERDGHICRTCFESRLGRPLEASDLSAAPVNATVLVAPASGSRH